MWTQVIREIIRTGYTNAKDMESVVGRNNQIGYIMPQLRYFINRLRCLQKICETGLISQINGSELLDLILWSHIIQHASTKGIRINNIKLILPQITICTDAYPFGFGLVDSNGLFWIWPIPPELFGIFIINFLECFSSYLSIFTVIGYYPNIRYICILAKTDS